MKLSAISFITITVLLLVFISGCTGTQEESGKKAGYIVTDIHSAPLVNVAEGFTLYRLINPEFTDTKGNDIPYDLAFAVAKPGAGTGHHVLKSTSQGFFIMSGNTEISANETQVHAEKGDYVLVPADTLMNIKNSGDEDLKIYTICEPYYTPDAEIAFDGSGLNANAFPGNPEIIVKSVDNSEPEFFRNMFYFTGIIGPEDIRDTICEDQVSYDLGYVVIPPGECSTVHKLSASGETIVILSGSGRVNIDNDMIALSEGRVVHIPVDSVQAIINNGNNDLIYLSIIYPEWNLENDILINQDCSMLMNK